MRKETLLKMLEEMKTVLKQDAYSYFTQDEENSMMSKLQDLKTAIDSAYRNKGN